MTKTFILCYNSICTPWQLNQQSMTVLKVTHHSITYPGCRGHMYLHTCTQKAKEKVSGKKLYEKKSCSQKWSWDHW